MLSAHALAPSHRVPTPRRAGRVAGALLLAVCSAVIVAPAPTLAAVPYPRLERLALSLLNCTRTGGWVRTDGSCKGRGSGNHSARRKALRLNSGIANLVARPYSYKLAKADACEHGLAGSSISARFRAAGYNDAAYGESIGCSSGWTVRRMVIRTHRMMQSEKSYNGWHWRNMKNRDFRSVGIGVMAAGKESRVVYDFYGR